MVDYELLKRIANKHNDNELLKVACELEKDAGLLQWTGNALTGLARKAGKTELASKMEMSAGDYLKSKLPQGIAHPKPDSLINKLRSASSDASTKFQNNNNFNMNRVDKNLWVKK